MLVDANRVPGGKTGAKKDGMAKSGSWNQNCGVYGWEFSVPPPINIPEPLPGQPEPEPEPTPEPQPAPRPQTPAKKPFKMEEPQCWAPDNGDAWFESNLEFSTASSTVCAEAPEVFRPGDAPWKKELLKQTFVIEWIKDCVTNVDSQIPQNPLNEPNPMPNFCYAMYVVWINGRDGCRLESFSK